MYKKRSGVFTGHGDDPALISSTRAPTKILASYVIGKLGDDSIIPGGSPLKSVAIIVKSPGLKTYLRCAGSDAKEICITHDDASRQQIKPTLRNLFRMSATQWGRTLELSGNSRSQANACCLLPLLQHKFMITEKPFLEKIRMQIASSKTERGTVAVGCNGLFGAS